MKIMRSTKSFRIAAKGGRRRGFVEGDLVPDTHPLVKQLPSYFEPVEDFVARNHPDLVPSAESSTENPKRRLGRPQGSKNKTKPAVEVSEKKDEADNGSE